MVRVEQCAKAEQCKRSRAERIVADPTRSEKSMSAEQTRTQCAAQVVPDLSRANKTVCHGRAVKPVVVRCSEFPSKKKLKIQKMGGNPKSFAVARISEDDSRFSEE